MKAEVKKDNVVLTLELSQEELSDIYDVIGNLSTADYLRAGISEDKSVVMYSFYDALSTAYKGV